MDNGVLNSAVGPNHAPQRLIRNAAAIAGLWLRHDLPEGAPESGAARQYLGVRRRFENVGCGIRKLSHCLSDLDPEYAAHGVADFGRDTLAGDRKKVAVFNKPVAALERHERGSGSVHADFVVVGLFAGDGIKFDARQSVAFRFLGDDGAADVFLIEANQFKCGCSFGQLPDRIAQLTSGTGFGESC